ncbi:hypothetical protein HG531_009213 [Fusarium graminearum]|nr:hypothetical protein HG531_009213 [Fusarium graminearum]
MLPIVNLSWLGDRDTLSLSDLFGEKFGKLVHASSVDGSVQEEHVEKETALDKVQLQHSGVESIDSSSRPLSTKTSLTDNIRVQSRDREALGLEFLERRKVLIAKVLHLEVMLNLIAVMAELNAVLESRVTLLEDCCQLLSIVVLGKLKVVHKSDPTHRANPFCGKQGGRKVHDLSDMFSHGSLEEDFLGLIDDRDLRWNSSHYGLLGSLLIGGGSDVWEKP